MRVYSPHERVTSIVLSPEPKRGIIVRPEDWQGGDRSIAKYFWTSTDKDETAFTCSLAEIERVIKFGISAKPVVHGTPFGHGHLTLHFDRVPMVLVMQLLRHRVQSPSGNMIPLLDWQPNVSQKSGRYTDFINGLETPGEALERIIYLMDPTQMRTQVGRPGHYAYNTLDYDVAREVHGDLQVLYQHALEVYARNLDRGLCNEQARLGLPQSTLTRLYLTASYRNWLTWCVQRHDLHAQEEIRQAGEQVDMILKQIIPMTHGLWEDYGRRPL